MAQTTSYDGLYETPWDVKRDFDIITFTPDCLSITLTRNKNLQAISDRGGSFTLNGDIRNNNWYIVILKAQQGQSSFQLRELTFNQFSYDASTNFFPFGSTVMSFDSIVVGIDKDRKSNGFSGNIRNVKLISKYLDDTTIQKIQYTYLYPTRDLKLELLLSDANELRNEADRATAVEVIKNGQSLYNQIDYMGNLDCFNPPTTGNQQFLKFSSTLGLQEISLNGNLYSTTSNQNTAIQLWFKRNSYVNVNTLTQPDEVLFWHQSVTKISFLMSDYSNLRVDGKDSKVFQAKAPFNRWIFLQVTQSNLQLITQLFDSDGQISAQGTLTFSKSNTTNSKIINIAQNFNGYIYGIKFYKTNSPPVNGIHAMDYKIETNSNALLYFILAQQGMNSDYSFQNLVSQAISQTLQNTGTRVFIQDYFNQYGTTSTVGTINNPLNFDGYTCKDNKEKLYMPDDASYLYSTFNLNSSLSSYTLEFWVRTTQTVSGSAFYIALQETSRQKQIYLAVVQESGLLKCYPFYQLNNTLKLDYLDYTNSIQDWVHIACVFNTQAKNVQGQLYYQKNDFTYFTDISSNTQQSLSQQQYSIYLNTNPQTMKNGVAKSYYSEVRFWDYARDQFQIRGQRFMRLNVSQERPNLYSYMKLAYGNYGGVTQEIDFADQTLQTTLESRNIQWLQNTDLLICPEGMFRGDLKDYNCYREGIISLELVIYKTSLLQYVISPKISIFRNNYLRDNSNLIYDHTWSLDGTDTQNTTNTQLFPNYFNPQIKQQELTFGFDQVTDRPGNYDFTLKLIDANNWQNPLKQSIKLRTYKCANIFDAITQKSFVQLDMKSTKTVDNAVFTYAFSDCTDYVFDQSSMTFGIDVPGLSIFSSDHNAQTKTFTIRTSQQVDLPSNEYFNLKLKGVWRNVLNRNDILEYYLIYSSRYISKLIITLTPNYFIATLGTTVIIDYDAKLFNLNKAIVNRDYTIQWTCPGTLNDFCKNQQGSLKLNYDQVINSGMELWKPQTFTITGYTNFIQGDGLKQTSSSVQITWMNLKPSANLIQITPSLISNSVIAYQFDVQQISEEQIQLDWSITPVLASKCIFNSDYRKQYVFNSSCLLTNQNYTLKADLYYRNQTQLLFTKQMQVLIPTPPSNGGFTCLITSGKAYVDLVTCIATGWKVQIQPAHYQFFLIDSNQNMIAISPLSIFASVSVTVQPTTRIYLKVVDGNNQFTLTSISVGFNLASSTDQILAKISIALDRGSSKIFNTNYVQDLQWVAQYLNQAQKQIDKTKAQAILSSIANSIHWQSQNIDEFNSTDQKTYFIRGAIQIFTQITNYSQILDLTSLNMIQASIQNILIHIDLTSSFIQDQDFQNAFFQTQANILVTLYNYQQSATFSSYQKQELDQLSNVTSQLRIILTNYEQYISTQIYEGQVFTLINLAFNLTIRKYSRLANLLYDQSSTDSSFIKFQYPLSTALQPTERQTLTTINFHISPFIGSQFLNQSANSYSSIYFSYRDMYGNYLSGDNILGRIQMIFKYEFSPLINLQNSTTCGYIKSQDTQWENSSCDVTFYRESNQIMCSCKHMSFYAIIDDFLRRETNGILYITFNNWYSIIPLCYMILLFVFGLIYSYSKDHQDFRGLNISDETLGNMMISRNSVTIQSLVFKRKVFYTGFGEKYSFCTLLKIMIMQLHPVFQIKYRFDPQLPRFYKFLFLYTRVMIIFAISFYFIRDFNDIQDVQNSDDIIITLIKIFVILGGGALILSPLPSFLYCCCKSKYYLIRQKGGQQISLSDIDKDESNSVPPIYEQERFTNVIIDTNLPLKLLFLLNLSSTDKIIREYKGSLQYSSGEVKALGQKLFELDTELNSGVIFQHTDNDQTKRKLQEDITPEKTKDFRDLQFNDQNQQTSHKSNFDNGAFETKDKLFSQDSFIRKIQLRTPHGLNISFTPDKSDLGIIDHTDLDYELKNDEELKQSQSNIQGPNFDDHSPYTQRGRNHFNSTQKQLNGIDDQDDQSNKSDIMIESFLGSLESQVFADEKKELVEKSQYCGRLFGNILAFIINIGILAGIFNIYNNEKYYIETDHYIWICVFFAAQALSFFLIDFIVILFMAINVAKCCQARKSCLARWMRESLCIYEDYKYVVNFTETKIE